MTTAVRVLVAVDRDSMIPSRDVRESEIKVGWHNLFFSLSKVFPTRSFQLFAGGLVLSSDPVLLRVGISEFHEDTDRGTDPKHPIEPIITTSSHTFQTGYRA